MKVYYIGNTFDGCYYVRCMLPLVAGGWDGTRTSIRGRLATPTQMLEGALDADIVVFQRPDDGKKLDAAKLLKQKGKKIVFDNDDTYIEDSGVSTKMDEIARLVNNPAQRLKEMNQRLYDFIAEADLVTTTTETLAGEYRKINENVLVLPNMVDPLDWDEPLRNEGDKVRIGMVGSVVGERDYERITDLIEELGKRDDVQLVILGLVPDDPKYKVHQQVYAKEIAFWKTQNVEWHPFVPHYEYNEKLNDLRLDIMLIPRHDSYFNRCKSNVKFLEASMCEIPVIAQGFADGKSPYQDPEDARHMVVITDNSKWGEEVERLIGDKKLRRKMGREAHEYVLSRYDIYKNIHLWEEAYARLID